MRNPGGYSVLVEPGKAAEERDTFTCIHCNTIVEVTPKMSPAEMGGFCRLCMKPVCKNCADKGCTPFEKRLEAMEQRAKFFRSVIG